MEIPSSRIWKGQEVKLLYKDIDLTDYKKYFDWGIVGEHMIARALRIKEDWDRTKY